ncbi:hypothetical protein AAY473_001742 [Plecturocebus cupreus]
MKCPYVAQAGLDLLGSSNPSVLASHSAGVRGVSHHTQPPDLSSEHMVLVQRGCCGYVPVGQAGMQQTGLTVMALAVCVALHVSEDWSAVAPRRLAETSISWVQTGFHHVGHAGLELLTSGDPLALASQSSGIAGLCEGQPAVLGSLAGYLGPRRALAGDVGIWACGRHALPGTPPYPWCSPSGSFFTQCSSRPAEPRHRNRPRA